MGKRLRPLVRHLYKKAWRGGKTLLCGARGGYLANAENPVTCTRCLRLMEKHKFKVGDKVRAFGCDGVVTKKELEATQGEE